MSISIFKKKEDKKVQSSNQPQTQQPQAKKVVKKEDSSSGQILRSSRSSVIGENAAKAVAQSANQSLDQGEKTIIGLEQSKTVLDEAAIFFANGESEKAIAILIKHLNDTKGQAPVSAWYMLLDAYQATNQPAPFEKLSIYFSSRFKASPPSWHNIDSPDKKSNLSVGRNALSIDGIPSSVSDDKISDFISASKHTGNCRIDLSRIKISESDELLLTGLTKINEVLTEIRKLKIPVQLMGDAHLIEKLTYIVNDLENKPEEENKIFWNLLLELYQWSGEEDLFEDLAIRYAMSYEESPPGYLTDNVVISADLQESIEDNPIDSQGRIIPETVIDQQNIDKLTKKIEEVLRAKGSVLINFENVSRMDFYSSGTLANFLGNLNVDKSKIVIDSPIELITLLSEITGASSFFTVKNRKR